MCWDTAVDLGRKATSREAETLSQSPFRARCLMMGPDHGGIVAEL
jgi:hypothetical protein